MTTTQRTAAIAAVVSLILAVVFYMGVYKPQGKKLDVAHKARAAAEQQISGLSAQASSLTVLEKELPSDEAKLAQYKQDLPDNPQLPEALDQIDTAASTSGVALTGVDPSGPPASSSTSSSGSSGSTSEINGVPTIPVAISTTGDYSQLMTFVRALDTMTRTLVVQNFAVSGTEPKLTGTISASIFYAGQPTP